MLPDWTGFELPAEFEFAKLLVAGNPPGPPHEPPPGGPTLGLAAAFVLAPRTSCRCPLFCPRAVTKTADARKINNLLIPRIPFATTSPQSFRKASRASGTENGNIAMLAAAASRHQAQYAFCFTV